MLAIALLTTLSGYAQVVDQSSKVIVGTYVSTRNGKIQIKGEDGSIYLLDASSIDSSIKISGDGDKANVSTADGLPELKSGSTVIINVEGIVVAEVKEARNEN
ncbi:MAG: hypothetical protein SNF68_01040 [Rikenellaceae bacterium]